MKTPSRERTPFGPVLFLSHSRVRMHMSTTRAMYEPSETRTRASPQKRRSEHAIIGRFF